MVALYSLISFYTTLSISYAAAAAISSHDAHDHAAHSQLPARWYHPRDHSAYSLFRRDGPPSDASLPQVGSPEWFGAYPSTCMVNQSATPPVWLEALNQAVADGQIPDIPPSSLVNGNPTYPDGLNPAGQEVCSATYECRIPGDIWDAPDGVFGSGFDDGPLPPSDQLYDFLKSQNVPTTHFMIGINILQNSAQFSKAVANGDDIAVHTYCHPYMTTLSNEDVVAELGWTMQIIHDSTGGRLPRYWRPPFGDSDARVRAIAQSVFGLETIIWNQDTADWTLSQNGTTLADIQTSMTQWLTGPKSPGLIILEHELSNDTVQAYMNAFPLIRGNNWTITSVVQLASQPAPYQNVDAEGNVTPQSIVSAPASKSSSLAVPSTQAVILSAAGATSTQAGAQTNGLQAGNAQATQHASSGAEPSRGLLSRLPTIAAVVLLSHLLSNRF